MKDSELKLGTQNVLHQSLRFQHQITATSTTWLRLAASSLRFEVARRWTLARQFRSNLWSKALIETHISV